MELIQQGFNIIIVDDLSNSSLSVLEGIKKIIDHPITFIELDLKDKKPSYLALKQDECNATVKVTEKTGLEIVNTESFDVNVCKKEVYKIIN